MKTKVSDLYAPTPGAVKKLPDVGETVEVVRDGKVSSWTCVAAYSAHWPQRRDDETATTEH